MKVSASWAQAYLSGKTLDASSVVSALERSGMEIESVLLSQLVDSKIVVGLIREVKPHPQADRLHLVVVSDGSHDYGVVCGAPNVRAGMKAPLAKVGARLPTGDVISKVRLRGETSEGMLCSERELGLGPDHEGILELPASAPVGCALSDIYPQDAVIDLKTPANRFDLLSVLGIAREVAALSERSLNWPELEDLPAAAAKHTAAVHGSPRYMLCKIQCNNSKALPSEILSRLQISGVRSVSPIVDITNYVMLEVGQPMHAFDAAKVNLPISARYAQSGEKLTTLDGIERQLSKMDLVIADTNGPIALAGVMGGAATEVTESTREVLLEVAVFDPVAIRKTAQRHGLRSEASARMERGLPINLPAVGMKRALALMTQLLDARVYEVSDVISVEPKSRRIELAIPHLVKILGMNITAREASDALQRLEIPNVISQDAPQRLIVDEAPWWRTDLALPEDLIEEIIRVVGYDRLPATVPSWRPKAVKFDTLRSKRRLIRDVLYAAGMFEVMTYSFISKQQIERLGLATDSHLKLKNPLSIEQEYMRRTMLASHLDVAAANRTYSKDLSFYEIGRVFLKRDSALELPHEPERLAVAMVSADSALGRLRGIVDLLSNTLHVDLRVLPGENPLFAPHRYGQVMYKSEQLGELGLVHPKITSPLKISGEFAFMELNLDKVYEAVQTFDLGNISRYPSASRDITIWLPAAITWEAVREALANIDVRYVGDFYGSELPQGVRALTIRVVVQHMDRTPHEDEVEKLESDVRNRLSRRFGAVAAQ